MTLNDSTGSQSLVSDSRSTHRILLIDEHWILREAVRHLVDGSDEFEIVGEAGGATEALQLIDSLQPDIVLTNAPLPDRTLVNFTRACRSSRFSYSRNLTFQSTSLPPWKRVPAATF